MVDELRVDVGTWDKVQLRIGAGRVDVQMAGPIGRIVAPSNFAGGVEQREPSKASVVAHTLIDKTVLPIAPGAKHHSAGRVGVDDAVSPAWRHDHFVALAGEHGDADSGIVVRTLLSINDGFAIEDFKQFGRGPSAVGRDGVNVALAAGGLLAKPTGGVDDHAVEKHAPPEERQVGCAGDIHGDAVDGIGASAMRVEETGADGVETAELGGWTHHAGAIVKAELVRLQRNIQHRYRNQLVILAENC